MAGKNVERLDRHGYKWLLITLEEDVRGEGLIPGIPGVLDGISTRMATFATLTQFVTDPPANSQESSLSPLSSPASLLDPGLFWRFLVILSLSELEKLTKCAKVRKSVQK